MKRLRTLMNVLFCVLQMEQIKRANRLYTNDSIFLKKCLFIPVLAESLSFPGENERHHGNPSRTDSHPRPQSPEVPAELSPSDYFRRMDRLIRESKQAAVKTCQSGHKESVNLNVLNYRIKWVITRSDAETWFVLKVLCTGRPSVLQSERQDVSLESAARHVGFGSTHHHETYQETDRPRGRNLPALTPMRSKALRLLWSSVRRVDCARAISTRF